MDRCPDFDEIDDDFKKQKANAQQESVGDKLEQPACPDFDDIDDDFKKKGGSKNRKKEKKNADNQFNMQPQDVTTTPKKRREKESGGKFKYEFFHLPPGQHRIQYRVPKINFNSKPFNGQKFDS